MTLAFTDIGFDPPAPDARRPLPQVLADHHRLVRDAFTRHGAVERGNAGDGLYFVFSSARGAVQAAIDAQLAIGGHPWPDGVAVKDRMGLHTGEPVSATEGYVVIDVHRAAPIGGAVHGVQRHVSQTTPMLSDELRPPLGLIDPGPRLRSLTRRSDWPRSSVGLEDRSRLRTTDPPRTTLPLQVTSQPGMG
jgi:hypothetical protein